MQTIRTAHSAEDAEQIASIQVETWRFAYQDIMPKEELNALDKDKKAGLWQLILADSKQTTLVIENEHQLVGFINVGACRDDNVDANTGKSVPFTSCQMS